jgi:hypothetical protein
LLAHGWWFSSGTPASSTTKTSRHDIAEILLKVALNTKNQNQFVDNCNFVFFLLAIVLSVLLRFVAFHYPFCIFKLFLHNLCIAQTGSNDARF